MSDSTQAPIEFSQEALDAFRQQLRKAQQGVRAVRLGVRGGACSGLQYVIEFDYGDPRPGDLEWDPPGWREHVEDFTQWSADEAGKAVSFRVDRKSVAYLKGARVTWHASLLKQGFEFENPNEASRCGCGHSFSAR